MTRVNKWRVVIDTNLLISGIITTGTPFQLLEKWKENTFTLLLSLQLLEEIKDISQRDYLKNYYLFSERIEELILSLRLAAEIVTPIPPEDLPLHSRDPKDDKLLSLALAGQADYLITGDKDLLILNRNPSLGKLKIITAKEFLNLI